MRYNPQTGRGDWVIDETTLPAEADTLQTVTDRGSTTDNNITTTGYLVSENFTTTAHYTGFPDRTATSLSWDDGTYTLSLTATDDPIWINGKKYVINTLTKQVTDTTGLYWFWITDPGGVPQLNMSVTAPGFDKCLVATVYWNTTTNKGIVSDERHWMGRDQWWHEYTHETIGARYASGMAGTFTNTTFTIGDGELYDEDIEHELGSNQSTAKVLYHNGSAAWAWDELTTPYKTVTGVIQYNNGNTLTSADNNKYVNQWVFVTGDVSHPIHIVIGTAQYTTITLARAASVPSLGSLASAETKLIYKVTYQNVGGTPTYVEATDYRASSNLPTGSYVATSHTSLSNLGFNVSGHYWDGSVNWDDNSLFTTGAVSWGTTTVSSGNLIVSSGNVGIGSTIPAQKLDVVGTAQMTGFKMPTGASSGYLLTSDSVGVGTWAVAPSGSQWITVGATIGTTSAVGIGTTVPLSKLEIVSAGTTSATNALQIMTSARRGLFTLNDAGYVGIGTTMASQTLDIWRAGGADTILIEADVGSTNFAVGNNAGTIYKEAQSFQVSTNTSITAVSMKLNASSGSPATDMKYTIQTNSGSAPSGTLVNANATTQFTPTYSDWNKASFPVPIALTASTTYWLVIEYISDPGTNKLTTIPATNTGSYASGNMSEYSGSWNNYGGSWDCRFRVYISDPTGYVKSMVLTADNGYLGIGTTTPEFALTVRKAGATASKKSGANTACTTTCGTAGCLFGQDTADYSVENCADTTSDVCICLGN
jgi:hypothetical protein